MKWLLHPDRAIARLAPLWRALLAILILAGLILLTVEGRARILRHGSEIRLQTAPVDPRDLFRGDYVVLSYEISTLDMATLPGDRQLARGDTVYVRLAPGPDGFAQARGVTLKAPAAGPGETILAGRITFVGRCIDRTDERESCPPNGSRLRIAYGLESYFVPQGTGREIERTERNRLEVVAAVSPSGQAAIKRLLIDGKLVHQEPPY